MNSKNLDSGVILIVDDNPTNLKVLFKLLADSGFKVLVAQDGEDALEQLDYGLPDLILTEFWSKIAHLLLGRQVIVA